MPLSRRCLSRFAAIAAPTDRALEELRLLLAPDESVWIVDYGRTAPGLTIVDTLDCVQMVLPADVEPPPQSGEVVPLTAVNAHEMLALTDVAFPGFFRSRTYRMGSYCGVRVDGELAAMGGERLWLEGYPELSGICTHPAHRGERARERCHRSSGEVPSTRRLAFLAARRRPEHARDQSLHVVGLQASAHPHAPSHRTGRLRSCVSRSADIPNFRAARAWFNS